MANRNIGTRRRLCALPWVVLLMWVSGCAAPSSSSPVQVFTGSTPAVAQVPLAGETTIAATPNPCEARVLRTVTFTKSSSATRLRITYKDTAAVVANNGGRVFVVGRLDNVAIAQPTGLQMMFALVPVGTGLFSHYGSFTLVGYADGVAQGSHTLSFIYDNKAGPLGATFSCFVDSDPFLIEIDETA
jgi:hypothetical protein